MSVLKLVSICLLIVFYLLTICPVTFFFRTSNCPLNWQQHNGYFRQHVISDASGVIIFTSHRPAFFLPSIILHHTKFEKKTTGTFACHYNYQALCGIVHFCMVCHITIVTLLYMYYYEFLLGIM